MYKSISGNIHTSRTNVLTYDWKNQSLNSKIKKNASTISLSILSNTFNQ